MALKQQFIIFRGDKSAEDGRSFRPNYPKAPTMADEICQWYETPHDLHGPTCPYKSVRDWRALMRQLGKEEDWATRTQHKRKLEDPQHIVLGTKRVKGS